MGKKRVMIVDDEEDFLRVTKMNLEKTNRFEVLTLSSAKDIVSLVNMFKPDLILLDILMPVTGGIEVCKLLNKDPFGKDIPIIVISALEKTADRLKTYKEEVADYLVKPIEIDSLIRSIDKVLGKKED